MAGTRMLSSLPLQILLSFHSVFTWFFFVTNIFIYIYKSNNFLYPSGVLNWEVFYLFIYLLNDHVRIFLASKGNKVEQIASLVWSFLFAITVILLHYFYFKKQTYVLRVDYILNTTAFIFIGFEVFLGLITVFTFHRDDRF